MQRPVSKLMGYTIEASDGHIGTVSDVLFDEATLKVRWLSVLHGPGLWRCRVG